MEDVKNYREDYEENNEKNYEELGIEYTQRSILNATKLLEKFSEIESKLSGHKKITQWEWVEFLERSYDPKTDSINVFYPYFKNSLGERGVYVSSKETNFAEDKMIKREDEAMKWGWGFGILGFGGSLFITTKMMSAAISAGGDMTSVFINGLVIPIILTSAISIGTAKVGYEIGKGLSRFKYPITEEDFQLGYGYFYFRPYIKPNTGKRMVGENGIKISYDTSENEMNEAVKKIVAFNEMALEAYYENKGLSKGEMFKEKIRLGEAVGLRPSEFLKYAQKLIE